MPKGIAGRAEGAQGEPKGGPRGVQEGPRGDFGGVRKRSEKRRRIFVVGRVRFGWYGGIGGPGGGVRGGKPPLELDLELDSNFKNALHPGRMRRI